MSEKSSFKTNLRSLLDTLGMSVRELSEETGIPKGTLDRYLSTRASIPPADIAARIAAALGVTVEYLVNAKQTGSQEELPGHNHSVGSIIKTLAELSERDVETVLTLSRILKTQSAQR